MNILKELKIKDYATLCGTFCGISSIILSLESIVNPIFPGLLIILAIFMDTLDGYLARKLNQINEFGKELDSLSDVICFGVAPSILIYRAYTAMTLPIFSGTIGYASFILLIPCAIFIMGAVIRLAWFNVDEGEGYTGLPVPISAGFLTSLLLLDYYWFLTFYDSTLASVMVYITPIVMCVLAYLNVTPFIIYGKNVRKKSGKTKLLFILVAIIMIIGWILSFFWSFSPLIVVLIIFVIGLSICYISYGFMNFIKYQKSQ